MGMTRESLQRAVDNLKYRPDMRLHNVKLCSASGDPVQLTIRVDDAEISVPGRGLPGHFDRSIGTVGSMAAYRCSNDSYSYYFAFRPYLDQSLRRAPELDHVNSGGSGVEWCWVSDTHPNGVLTPCGFEPGENGQWIPDRTTSIQVPIPPEFEELCKEVGLSPLEVLRGFIADVCGILNYAATPRADGFSSNGSDERDMAAEYFERAYSVLREANAGLLAQSEANAQEAQRREDAMEQVDLALGEYLMAGGDYDTFVAAVEGLLPPSARTENE
jgi:hypothetical protein